VNKHEEIESKREGADRTAEAIDDVDKKQSKQEEKTKKK
jgi:hypothetical protein